VISIGRRALEVGRVLRWLLAIAVVACAVALSTAASAAAGTYDVWSCHGPDGESVDADAWQREAIDPVSGIPQVVARGVEFGDDCDGAGGSLAVALTRGELLNAPVAGLLTFRAPTDTRIASYELARFLDAGQPPLLTTYIAERVETEAGTPVDFDLCSTAGCMLGGPDPSSPGSLVSRPQAEGDAIALRVEASCPLICANLLLSDTPARAALYRSRVTLEDLHPPAVPQLGGALIEDGPDAGRASLVVASQDRGGGIEAMSLAIDGQPWQTVRMGGSASSCRTPYTSPTPCPRDVEQPFEADTGALSAGEHELSGSVVDAAGNSTAWGPVPFRVEKPPTTVVTTAPPGPEGPSNGMPAVERPRLQLGRRVAVANAGGLVRLRGTLTTWDRRPIASARLAVTVRQLGLRATVPARDRNTVVTDRNGRFVVEQRARGAQRIAVGFSPRPGGAATARATATVRTRLELLATPTASRVVKGRLLRLRGRLRGAGPSADGALVQIQAIVNGRWAPVGRARANRDGSYRWRYRFVHLTRDTVFNFRAVVEHVPGWPWPTVRSPRTTVRVDVP